MNANNSLIMWKPVILRMTAIEELKKAKAGWEKQKENKLTDARIADAHIESLQAAIELVEHDKEKKKPE